MADVRSAAADIVERYVHGKFKVRERAEGAVSDLHTYWLLAGQEPSDRPALPVQELAVNLLRCRHSDRDAERIAAELAEAGLLREDA